MQKNLQVLLILTIIRLVLPFFLQDGYYQPHRDEYLYLDYAKHMDWGYMEVPPLLSVFSWLSWQMGHGIFWVKVWPALVGAFTFFLCGHLALLLGGGRMSLLYLFLCFTFGAFLRVFYLFQPGFLEIFTWTSIFYTLVRFHLSNHKKWLYLFGLACGLGMLSKYTTLFLIVGLIGGFLLSSQRRIFTNKHFWAAALLGFLLFLPNLYWQYQHRFPVFAHMQELRETQLVYINPSDFIIGQFMLHFVVAFVWIAGLLVILFSSQWKAWRWVGLTYFLAAGLLLAGKAKDYYALGLYPILFVFGGVWLDKATKNWFKIFRYGLPALPFLLGLFIVPLGLPVFEPQKLADYYEKNGFREALGFKWEDQQNHPLPQDFADMMGWREITEMTAKHYQMLPDSIKKNTAIYCRGYYTAGAINYFGRNLQLPEAISDNGSYLLWIPENWEFRHLMMVGHKNPTPDDVVFNHFERREVLDSINMPLFRENGIKLFMFHNANDSMLIYAREGIRQEQAAFKR